MRLLPIVLVLLAACGGAPETAGVVEQPTQTPYVIVVTATSVPPTETIAASATPKATTRIIRFTVTPRATPTGEPTITPSPSPTVPSLTVSLRQNAGLFSQPDEGYASNADLAEGEVVEVLYKGGEWFQVRTNAGKEGWVYRDWIDVSSEVAEGVPTFPSAFPVIVGNVVQQQLAGSTIFKGKVFNVGASDAYRVRVEIETLDGDGNRLDLVNGYLNSLDLAAGTADSFQAITTFRFDSYTATVHWFDNP